MPGPGTQQGGRGMGRGQASAAAKFDDEDILSKLFKSPGRKKKVRDVDYDKFFPKSPRPWRGSED